jgi:transcriptional regulator with XRE-family HTH domain
MNLTEYLRGIGMTYVQFAEISGFDVSQISRWARLERPPSLAQAKQIRDATDGQVSFEDFLINKE